MILAFVIVGLIILRILWLIGSSIYWSVLEKKEEQALADSGILNEIEAFSKRNLGILEQDLKRYNTEVGSISTQLHSLLPGLKERIERLRRQQWYRENILPKKRYKSRNKKY